MMARVNHGRQHPSQDGGATRAEKEAFDRLKAELAHAFSAPEASYESLTAAQVIARNQTLSVGHIT
jgi:hypothetical protein